MILLNADEGKHGKWKKDEDIADFVEVIVRTIENIRRRFVEEGYEVALYGKPREREYENKIDGDIEAHLIALSCRSLLKGLVVGALGYWQKKWWNCNMLTVYLMKQCVEF